MKTIQGIKYKGSRFALEAAYSDLKAPLVMVFGNRMALEDPELHEETRRLFPEGTLVYGSTSGEIIGDTVTENSVVLTAIEFEKSKHEAHAMNLADYDFDETILGAELSKSFSRKGLKHVFVISEGSRVNGSALLQGMASELPSSVGVSGGLCGDDERFDRTLAGLNERPKEGMIVAIGLYGEELEVSCANFGGWTPFGPERTITKSKGNILHELDGTPALDLYKSYLGEKAEQLPTAALLYPLQIRTDDHHEPLVRTVLSVDETTNEMQLAGDVPVGSRVQLMMSNMDDIINGAYKAAELAMAPRKNKPQLAILVSCVGRKMVLDQRTEEEVEEVLSVIGGNTPTLGFYGYGEMAPFSGKSDCKLHNQTMTLTLLSE